MNKQELNKQIILFRPLIKRSRVCTIRRILKKVDILKACKKESGKVKMLKKAERMVEQVLIMKKVKDDDVTKFALLHTNLDEILKSSKANDHDHVYAMLAKHKDVQKKLADLRQHFTDFDSSIDNLLQSLGERSMLKKWKVINKGLPPRQFRRTKKEISDIPNDDKPSKNDEVSDDESVPDVAPKEDIKIVDSFFIDKKIVAPKLLLENDSFEKPEQKINFLDKLPPRRSSEKRFSKPETNRGNNFRHSTRSQPENFKEMKPATSVSREEKLHPSWAAKKAQTLQPFQGKKIKFELD